MMNPQSTILNDWSDFWYKDIGVNVIPANTKDKNTFESWTNWKDQSIPVEVHESRKKNGHYNNGIAIITGRIWRGPYTGKYLVAIDFDNKIGIDAFCGSELEYLKQHTLFEQTSNPEKAHIYFIVEREIPNKSSSKVDSSTVEKLESNDIPALEVKSNSKGIMFCAASPHKNGSNYRIIGTLKPEVFSAVMIQERISRVCNKYNIPYGFDGGGGGVNNNSESYKIPIEDLFKPETKIYEGENRHEAILRVMDALLSRNKGILTLDQIKKLSWERNQGLCVPPLDDIEMEKQWKCSTNFIGKNIVLTGDTGDTGANTEKVMSGDDDYDNEDEENKKKSSSSAETIVQLALKNSTLFKDEFGIPYALLEIDNIYEVLSIDGSKFKHYLSKLYYDKCDKKIANAESISNAIRTLGAKAVFEGKTIPLYLKVAWSNPDTKDAIYYDLSDKERRCIKITKGNGWKITENQIEVLFKRYGHQSAQVEPLHPDYDPSNILDNFVNSLNIKNEKHKLIVKVWIVSLLIPEISHPMLLPYGEKGSAKSTMLRKIKMVIDPSGLDLYSVPYRKDDFIQQISHSYLCFYDNVKHEPNWLSDEVCRATTGGVATKRKLYSDDDDIPYKYKKILGFAGINVIFTEPDALDRSIKIELERIREEYNIPDSKIDEELKKQIPELLGYIFDIVSKTLEVKDSLELARLPRMGDFAEWGEAISRALGYKPLEFLNTYFENIGEQNIEIIEANPFAEAISRFIDYDKESWISAPLPFINSLREYADSNNIDSSKFPKNATALSRRLNKIKSNLRRIRNRNIH